MVKLNIWLPYGNCLIGVLILMFKIKWKRIKIIYVDNFPHFTLVGKDGHIYQYKIIKEIVPKIKEAVLLEEFGEAIKTAKIGDIVKIKDLFFYNNSPKIVSKSKANLYELLCVMNDNPKLKIEVQGHICCQIKEGQYDVSTARARSVCVFLVQNGINRKRITFKGFGSSRPIHPIPEQSEQEEEENRRVEIRIVEN